MRICYICVGNFPHVAPYIDFFHAAGHDVHFIALSPSPPRPVPVYNLGYGKGYSRTTGKWKYPLSMLGARRLVSRLKPDIVHTHYATSGGLAGLACGFHPTIVTAHGTDLTTGSRSRIWRMLLRAVFKQADCVNTVSEDLKGMALALGAAPGKVRVLTPGVDCAAFAFRTREPVSRRRPLRLVCTRNLEPVYDPRTIVEAMALLKKKGLDLRMTFCGDGSLRAPLMELVARRGLGGEVVFLGAVDHRKLPTVLDEQDVYLSASLWDGASLSLLEAMAGGLFPVVSRIKANAAWLRDGEDGFLHRVGEPEDLAACVLRLVERPEAARTAAARNRALVAEAGDRTTNMRRLESLYRELAGRGSAA